MYSLLQPSLRQLYVQASRQSALRRDADGLPVCQARWHIELTTTGPKSHLQRLSSNHWQEGPPLTPAALADEGQMAETLRQVARHAETAPEYVQMIVHVANELFYNQQRSDLPPAIRDYAKVRRALLHADPARVVADDIRTYLTADTWMDAPGPAEGRIALRLPLNRWAALRQAYETVCKGGLYRIAVTHAAVESLAVSIRLALESDKRPFLHFLTFSQFGVIAAVSPTGTVTLLRRVEMPAGEPARDIARQLDEVATVGGLTHAGLVLVPMSDVPVQKIVDRIINSHGTQEPVYDKAALVTLSSAVVADRLKQEGASGAVECLKPHHLFWIESFWDKAQALRESCDHGFYSRTAAQNEVILPVGLGLYPRLINAVRPVTIAAATAAIAWMFWTAADAVRDPAWKLTMGQRQASEKALRLKETELDHTEQNKRRMATRGSVALTGFVTQTLFPQGSGVTLEKLNFDFTPLLAADSTNRQQIGGTLIWVYRGRATGEGLKKVEAIAADSGLVRNALREASGRLGLPSLVPNSSAEVKVSSSVQRGTSNQGDSLFELRIERRIDSQSELALPVARKEKE